MSFFKGIWGFIVFSSFEIGVAIASHIGVIG
jgi:hypothetical protein